MITAGSTVRKVPLFHKQYFQAAHCAVPSGSYTGNASADDDDIIKIICKILHIQVSSFKVYDKLRSGDYAFQVVSKDKFQTSYYFNTQVNIFLFETNIVSFSFIAKLINFNLPNYTVINKLYRINKEKCSYMEQYYFFLTGMYDANQSFFMGFSYFNKNIC
jgi:hypothetical protein